MKGAIVHVHLGLFPKYFPNFCTVGNIDVGTKRSKIFTSGEIYDSSVFSYGVYYLLEGDEWPQKIFVRGGHHRTGGTG